MGKRYMMQFRKEPSEVWTPALYPASVSEADEGKLKDNLHYALDSGNAREARLLMSEDFDDPNGQGTWQVLMSIKFEKQVSYG